MGCRAPHLYSVAYGGARPGTSSAASDAIDDILRTLVGQAARAGRVSVPVAQAVDMQRAVGTGVVFALIAMPEDGRDLRLSVRGREAALSTFVVGADPARTGAPSGAAMQLEAGLASQTRLTANERALLGDWLDRLASDA